MKKYTIICCLMIAFFFQSCDELGDRIGELSQISFNHTETVDIKAEDLMGLDQNLYSEQIVVPLDEEITTLLESNGFDSDLVEKIFLEELTLTITDPVDSDFSWLVNFNFSASSTNIEEVEIASVPEVPASIGNVLTFDVDSSIDLLQFLQENELTLSMNAEITDDLEAKDYTLDVTGKFTIDVNVLGE